MPDFHSLAIVVVAALVTAGLRFLPFLLFGENRKTPQIITYLGTVLPFAIMGMLVVYCLKDVSFSAPGGWLPQLIGCLVVAGLHIWKRNTLLSIGAGTLCYMLLVQFIS